MRLVVFFDLPTTTPEERRKAVRFRKYLIRQGFSMLQCSVYIRTTSNYDESEKYIAIVEAGRPEKGDVRCLKITEQQYTSIEQPNNDLSLSTEELIVI